MPVSPDQVEYLAAVTADLYAGVERQLLELCARQLAAGLDAPGWAVAKLAALSPLRRAADVLLGALAGTVDTEVRHAVAEAYDAGRASALEELDALPDEDRRTVAERTPHARAVDRLAAETIDTVTSTHRGILRAVEDGYRQVVAEVTAAPLLGTETRRQATQQAMQRFADRGISSFRDRAGRRWSLTAYAEMAVRTSVARAATEAHMTTLADAGIDLVIVSNSPRECPLCRPWERRILSIGGPDGARTVEVEHALDDGRMIRVDVAGSLDEARRAGLQHPNCRHSVSSYTPGLTRVEEPEPDPAGYEAGQRQRAIERHIRRHKNRAAAATTPEAKRAAEAKVRQWQGAMRDHLAAHPDLRRLRHREQPGASNLPARTKTAPDDFMQAARVRAGDDGTLREMSDDQLGAAMRPGVLDDRARDRIATEADRRDREALLDRVRTGDLSAVADDDLAEAMRHGRAGDLARIAAEFDRRYPPEPLPAPARSGDAVEDLIADRAALDDLLAPAPDPDGWAALADDDTWAALVEQERAAQRTTRAARHAPTDEPEQVPRVTRRVARQMYDEYVMRQYLAAEEDLRGVLLNKQAEQAGHDPVSLFSGPARIAHARASDELRAWWAEHGRLTQAEFIESVTGERQRWAEGARKNESDHQNKR
ncbi:phage capsid protein [Streptomyces albofaciens JCM 4342]|uniref:phage minor capsid protein n=2 Tax=Streptomyces albofaciens TaxID=66866 RepID=UPI00123C683B|nr:phage minor capsid protein [Streptomyces albofaciens]KAA6220636.1 phage capsid protein [Streptomyces albofaciens JCM 4342]